MNLPVMWNLAAGRYSGQAADQSCQPSLAMDYFLERLRFGFECICSRHRGGGNVGIAKRFQRTEGRAENLVLVFRAFLRSAFPRLPASTDFAEPLWHKPQWSPLIRPMAVTKNPANGQRGKTIGWAASDGGTTDRYFHSFPSPVFMAFLLQGVPDHNWAKGSPAPLAGFLLTAIGRFWVTAERIRSKLLWQEGMILAPSRCVLTWTDAPAFSFAVADLWQLATLNDAPPSGRPIGT